MTITIMAEEGPLTLGFDDLERYHGHAALAMLAITYRVQQAVFERLCPDAPPRREAISVISGHPGPGVRDAFEMVTRCVTRGAYTIDKTLPGPRLNPKTDVVYAFQVTVHGRPQHVALRDGVLPPEFFSLLGATDAADMQAGFVLRRRIAGDVLAHDTARLLVFA